MTSGAALQNQLANIRKRETWEATTGTIGFKPTSWLRMKKLLPSWPAPEPRLPYWPQQWHRLSSLPLDTHTTSTCVPGLLLILPYKPQFSSQKKPVKQQEGNSCLIPTFDVSEKCKVRQGWGKRDLEDNYQGILSSPLLMQVAKTLAMSPFALWWANARRTIQMSWQVPPWCWVAGIGGVVGTGTLGLIPRYLCIFLMSSPLGDLFPTTQLVLLLPILQVRKLRPTWLK